MSKKKTRAKLVRSTAKLAKKPRKPTGDKSKKKAVESPRGRGFYTATKRHRGGDRSHLASRPVGKPSKTLIKGKPTIRGRVTVNSAIKGKRPAIAAIKAWVDKRKHVEFWRNRDGSYEALVTFKGATSYEQLDRAVRMIPGHPYMVLRKFHKAQLADKGDTATIRVRLSGETPVYLKVFSSPTVKGETPEEGIAWAKVWVFDGDPNLYQRRVGLSVYWGP